MKKLLLCLTAVLFVVSICRAPAFAAAGKYARPDTATSTEEPSATTKATTKEAKEEKADPKFPEKGWHKGPYLAANVGFVQASNDTNLVTNRAFDGKIIPAFGLTFGWDIADWIGPMLQLNFGTATDQVGDGKTADTPIQDGREYVVDASLFVRATAPYFMHATWQPNMVKFIPYFKLGGTAHGLYVNASGNGNKTGAFGGGIGVGAGTEFYIWKGLFIAIDFTENIIFQKAEYKTVNGVPNSKILDGGTKMQAVLLGLFGWHF